MSNDELMNEFILEVKFPENRKNPASLFQSMGRLINSFQAFDNDIMNSFGIPIQSVLVLQAIEAGSIRAKLASILELIDDDALKTVDVRKMIGPFLVLGKHKIIDFCKERNNIESKNEVELLRDEISRDVPQIPDPRFQLSRIEIAMILRNIARITEATSMLDPNDDASIKSILVKPSSIILIGCDILNEMRISSDDLYDA